MIAIAPESPGHPDSLWCLDQYFSELERRFEGGYRRSMDPAVAETAFMPPHGLFLLARLDGRPAGCGAIKRADDQTGEIKRIWTAPDARGRGIARAILQRLEDAARAMGFSAVRLDSNRVLTEAHALYRVMGYGDIPRFNDDTHCHHFFGEAL
jgi:GNAT superfamily N-acetyltransferase